MDFQTCRSLKQIELPNNLSSSKMIMLDNMNYNQIEWCKEKNIIENLNPKVAKQLDMCAFYAIIPSDFIDEFYVL